METHHMQKQKIAEVIHREIIVGSVEEGVDLPGNFSNQDYDKLTLYEGNITPDFL